MHSCLLWSSDWVTLNSLFAMPLDGCCSLSWRLLDLVCCSTVVAHCHGDCLLEVSTEDGTCLTWLWKNMGFLSQKLLTVIGFVWLCHLSEVIHCCR